MCLPPWDHTAAVQASTLSVSQYVDLRSKENTGAGSPAYFSVHAMSAEADIMVTAEAASGANMVVWSCASWA